MKNNFVKLSVDGDSGNGKKNSINIRDFSPVIIDEAERLGGTNEGANPLEYFLGALSACTSIMASFTANEQNFTYKSINYSTDGWLDPRGYQGVDGVQTYFQKVRVNITIDTNESDEALAKLKEEVERRCPLFNLLKDADVDVDSIWIVAKN